MEYSSDGIDCTIGTVLNGALTNSNDFKYLTGVTSIPDSSFQSYAGDTFIFPPNVRTIGKNVLMTSSAKATPKIVIIGEHVQSIGDYFCRYKTSMQKVIIHANTPPTGATLIFRSSTAQNINSTFKIYVPDDSVSAYKSASNWSRFASQILPLSQLSE